MASPNEDLLHAHEPTAEPDMYLQRILWGRYNPMRNYVLKMVTINLLIYDLRSRIYIVLRAMPVIFTFGPIVVLRAMPVVVG